MIFLAPAMSITPSVRDRVMQQDNLLLKEDVTRYVKVKPHGPYFLLNGL